MNTSLRGSLSKGSSRTFSPGAEPRGGYGQGGRGAASGSFSKTHGEFASTPANVRTPANLRVFFFIIIN